jgi:hypothetical protein
MYILETVGVDVNFRLPDRDNSRADAEATTIQMFERTVVFHKTVVREDCSVDKTVVPEDSSVR